MCAWDDHCRDISSLWYHKEQRVGKIINQGYSNLFGWKSNNKRQTLTLSLHLTQFTNPWKLYLCATYVPLYNNIIGKWSFSFIQSSVFSHFLLFGGYRSFRIEFMANAIWRNICNQSALSFNVHIRSRLWCKRAAMNSNNGNYLQAFPVTQWVTSLCFGLWNVNMVHVDLQPATSRKSSHCMCWSGDLMMISNLNLKAIKFWTTLQEFSEEIRLAGSLLV